MPVPIRITDVSPRDGLQNEQGVIPTPAKVELVRLLCAAGVDEVEVTSFVSPRWVPQLGDAPDVLLASAAFKPPTTVFSALVPNEKGLDALLDVNQRAAPALAARFADALGSASGHAAGALAADPAAAPPLVNKASVFTAASETFSRKNTNASIAETIERFTRVVARAHDAGLTVRGYVSCVIACPFEGPIAPRAVVDVARRLRDLGVDELDLGDTIGAATPETTRALIDAVLDAFGAGVLDGLVLHLHDTFGRAASCARAALERGVRSFDGSVAGLGGCPYASTPGRRAPGNIATETLVDTIDAFGGVTAIQKDALRTAAAHARAIVAAAAAGVSLRGEVPS